MRIATVGSVNIDLMAWSVRAPEPGELVPGDRFAALVGGKGANVAVQIARSGADAALIGCVGTDVFGDLARTTLAEAGVDLSQLVTVDTHTGVGHVHVDGTGEYRSTVVPGANAFAPLDVPSSRAALRDAVAVVMQFETAAAARAMAVATAPEDALVVLNPSPWNAVEAGPLDGIDVLVCNATEADRYASHVAGTAVSGPQDALEVLRATVDLVVITLGADGALAHSRLGGTVRADGFTVPAVSTIGAGDAFLGEFIVALTHGSGLPAALTRGCAAGALATTVEGPDATAATREAIDALVAG